MCVCKILLPRLEGNHSTNLYETWQVWSYHAVALCLRKLTTKLWRGQAMDRNAKMGTTWQTLRLLEIVVLNVFDGVRTKQDFSMFDLASGVLHCNH